MAQDAIEAFKAMSEGSQQELRDAVSEGKTTMLPTRYFIREAMPILSEWGVAVALSGYRFSGNNPSSPQRIRIPEELITYIRSTL